MTVSENLVWASEVHSVLHSHAFSYCRPSKRKDEWFHLFEQEDWETPAREAFPQFSPRELRECLGALDAEADEDSALTPAAACLRRLEAKNGWRDFCEAHDLEPHRTEIYEHGIVSEWLADRVEPRFIRVWQQCRRP